MNLIASAIEVEERRKHLEAEREKLLHHMVESNESLEREVRDRKRAEEQLQRYAEKLAQTNEESKTFAYIVSHDLRAPVINFKGFIGELRMALEHVGAALAGDQTEEALKDRERGRWGIGGLPRIFHGSHGRPSHGYSKAFPDWTAGILL